MNLKTVLGALGLAAGIALVAAWPTQVGPVADFVLSADRAYVLANPEPVPVSHIRHIEWSPTGRYLMMIQESPSLTPAQAVDVLMGRVRAQTGYRLLTFDRSTRSVRDHGLLRDLFGEEQYLAFRLNSTHFQAPWRWFAGTDVAYAFAVAATATSSITGVEDQILRRFDVERGTLQVHRFGPVVTDSSVLTFPCPTLPAILEVHTQFGETGNRARVRKFDAKGRTSGLVDLGSGAAVFRSWVGNGSVAKFEMRVVENRTLKSSRTIYFDAAKSELVSFEAEPAAYRAFAVAPPIGIRITSNSTAAGVVKVDHRAVWLSANGPSDQPAVLLSSDADRAALSPKLDGVAVLNRGVVTVRGIVNLSRATLEEAMRAQAVLAAKEVGLGLLMYASDFDDEFPLYEQMGENVVDPYLRNPDWMRNFRYFRPQGQSGNPSSTLLGFIPAPGGYAAVYLDGHTEWKTGPPPKGG